MPRPLIVVPLGETPRADIERAVHRAFPAQPIEWLDRAALRRRPWLEVPRLVARQYGRAVLVTADLDQPRLALTSLVLGLVRAPERWRLDLHGRREPFAVGAHLRHVAWPITRHLAACGLALLLAYPLLVVLHALLRPRRRPRRGPLERVLYLRSLFWLGLQGGGSVAHTAGVIGGLSQAGVDVHVVSSDRLPGVDVAVSVARPTSWFDGLLREAEELAYNLTFFAAALQQARRVRPQALYQRHTAFNVVGAVLSRVLDVPFILEFNSSEVWKGQHWGGLHLSAIAGLVERTNLRAADQVIVVSQPLHAQLSAQGVPSEKILVNPNGVDPSHFAAVDGGTEQRTRLGLGSTTVICFSGTFGVWHGIPVLAEAIPRVLAARSHARFLLLGDGPLRHLVDGLGERVLLPGLVPHATVPGYLAAADIVVSPHGRQVDGGEFFGSPTKLYEYMAAGRPIVASGIGQIGQVLEHEATALLVPPDDPDALSAALVRLIDDPCLRVRLGEQARSRALAHHTWRHNADRLLAALRQ